MSVPRQTHSAPRTWEELRSALDYFLSQVPGTVQPARKIVFGTDDQRWDSYPIDNPEATGAVVVVVGISKAVVGRGELFIEAAHCSNALERT